MKQLPETGGMKVIAESTWWWMLYAQGDRRWLAVICGSVGLYETVIELNAEECARIAADSRDIEQLARAVSGAPSRYRSRHLPSFYTDPDACKATTAWREQTHGKD